ncbi:MAG: Ig-like domain repeat protein, partial [Chloroflexi bacterium]|nr:Ig-like domain repeat protein [Chloroflexota bacterium]
TAVTDTKVYDGTTSSAGVPTITAGSLASGDTATWTQTFNNKNVGTGKTLTPAGSVSDGNSGNNYSVTFVPDTTGVITARALTVSATGVNKVYDGTTGATVTLSDNRVPGDVLILSYGSATFDNKNVGAGKPVSVTGIAVTGADAANYTHNATAAATASIIPKALTVTGITANSKVYDGNTNATLNTGGATLVGVVGGDDVTLSTAGAVGAFANKHVGTGKTVTVSGLTISGDDAGNYTLTQPTTAANITARSITVTAATDSKVYDGTTSSAGVPAITAGSLASGDTATWTQTFNNKNVGTGKTLIPAGSVSDGNSGNNYSVTYLTNHTGVITARALTVSATGVNKVYDGTTGATVTLSDNRVAGDVLTLAYGSATFDNKNVGAGKPVSVTGIAVAGADAANYTHNTTAATTASITPKALTITADDASKAYGEAKTFAGTEFTTSGLVSGDTVTSVSLTSAGAAASAAAGTYSIVPSAAVGTGLNNYTITYVNGTLKVRMATSMSLVSSRNPSTFGQTVTLSVAVKPAVVPGQGQPGSTVEFWDGTTLLGSKTLNAYGRATFKISQLNAGTHTITAIYRGDDDFLPSASATLLQVVQKAKPSMYLRSSPNSPVYGQAVTFTATVTSTKGTPTGTVQFMDGSTPLGSPVTLVSGTATYTTLELVAGRHSITAVYSGDDNFTSSSKTLWRVVRKANTKTLVVSSSNPSMYGNPVTFTAAVTVPAPGSGTPTGTVTFKKGTTILGTADLSGGIAIFTTSTLKKGTHYIRAVYSGDGNFKPSTSATLRQVVM